MPGSSLPGPSRLAPIRGAFALAFAVGLVLVTASPAFAHDDLGAASPAPETTVGATLTQVELSFKGEPTEVQIFLRDRNGDELSEPATLTGTRQWTMPLSNPDIEPGFYAIRWEGVATDGDELEGFYTFTVQEGAADAPTIAEQVASGSVLPVDGVSVRDDGPSRLFLVLLGVSIALGAWTIWLAFNRLGNRLAADVDEPAGAASPASADDGDDR